MATATPPAQPPVQQQKKKGWWGKLSTRKKAIVGATAAVASAKIAGEGIRTTKEVVEGVVGGTVGAVTGTARAISPSSFTWLFILAVVNFYFDYQRGFQHDLACFGVDVLTLFLFMASGTRLVGSNSPFWIFLAETVIPFIVDFIFTLPGIMNDTMLSITGFFLVAPWWIIYCIWLRFQGVGQSKLVDIVIWAGSITALALLVFSSESVFITHDYAINQKLIDSFQDTLLNFKTNVISPAWQNIRYQWCVIIGDDFCVQELDKEKNKEALEQNFNIKEMPGSSFTMNIVSFVSPETILLENEQSTQIEAQTNFMPSPPIKLVFDCGIYKKGAGTPDPAELTLALGSLYASQGNINCKNLDISTKTTKSLDFYFNVTAKGVVSTGERTLLIMDEAAKKAVLSKYPGISETKIILASKEFGDIVKAQQDVLGSVVSKDDLVQPLTLMGGTTAITAKQSLIYGISKSEPVPFALYIKNNGKGNIARVSKVEFTLPKDLVFDRENCGLTEDVLNKINWRRVPRGTFIKVASCNLIISESEFPNNPQSRSVSTKLTYDYVLSKSEIIKIIPESEYYTTQVPLGESAPVLVTS